MTKLQDSQAGTTARTHELRQHPRRKLSGMAYVELVQDNGGILLNLSEGGFAIQSALALSSREFPELRFQLPNMRGWLTGSGRVVWMSESKKEAGIQFLDLREHARAQVRMWVSQDGLTEAAASAGGNGAPVGISSEMRRGSAANASVNASHGFLASRAGAEHARNETGAATIEHDGSAQAEDDRSFRFHDYSMFAADANAGVAWAEPVRQKRGWGSYILFTILLATLFFVLGAMIGRDNLNGLVSSVEGWKGVQREAPPTTKAPTPPTASTTPSGNDTASSGTHGAASNPTSATSTLPPADDKDAVTLSGATSEPKGAANTANGEAPVQEQSPVNNTAGSSVGTTSGDNSSTTATSGGSVVSKARERDVLPRKNSIASRAQSNYSNAEADSSNEYGRSILVNAPAPGSPPFFVHLPGEPVSASSSVAISARRSVQVPPRTYDGAYGTERMVVGKLLAHSDPFYPVEARTKHIEGIVELHAIVGRSGEVLTVTPVSGAGVLVAAGVTALHEWRYEPTFINGDPVETQLDVTMVFRSY
jgi:Gram-negative bacterial TonB protein C-terminal/PilZ domain